MHTTRHYKHLPPSLISTLYKSLHAKSSQPSLDVVTWHRIITMEILQHLWSRRCPLVNTPQLNCQLNYSATSSASLAELNSTQLIALTVLVITSRHGPHRKHRSFIVACVLVAAGTCSPSCCPETTVVYSPIARWLHNNGVHAIIYIYVHAHAWHVSITTRRFRALVCMYVWGAGPIRPLHRDHH
jgi:hypothetical protein